MACRLIGAKPLPETILDYHELGSRKKSVKFELKLPHFLSKNVFAIVVWKVAAILSRPQCVYWQSISQHESNAILYALCHAHLHYYCYTVPFDIWYHTDAEYAAKCQYAVIDYLGET